MTGRTVFAVARSGGWGALLISGTVGAGKTTAAEAVGDWLRAQAIPHAVIDLDGLRNSWPSPPGDRFNVSIELANLAAVAANFLGAGARRLVLAGVLEEPAMRRRYSEAVGLPLCVARLRIDVSLVHQRLIRRHADDPAALGWHLHRSGELHDVLQSAGGEDYIIDTDRLTVEQTAAALISAVGWNAYSSP